MADENRFNEDDKNSKKSPEFRVPPRTWMVWIAIIGAIAMLVVFKDKYASQPREITPYAFQQLVENSNLIAQIKLTWSPQSDHHAEVSGSYYQTDNDGNALKTKPPVEFRTEILLTDKLKDKLQTMPQFQSPK